MADALRSVDPVGARAVEHETAWRSRYLLHMRRLIEAGLVGPEAWTAIADAGLESVHAAHARRSPSPTRTCLSRRRCEMASSTALGTVEVRGSREPETEFTLPYRGNRLSGDALSAQLQRWADRACWNRLPWTR